MYVAGRFFDETAWKETGCRKLSLSILNYLNNGKVVPYGKEEAYADSYFGLTEGRLTSTA